ncbi:MAG: hypothetical protein A2270_07335 [Elusimicrobia bacterium RIFOXYA12_FULL_51_18]|nr:MAG: hypothetical protein A2270_07335 [Elusimicrobia bacterium RIFOXYA12_FULL_51_18]OGS28495.1 MAG: hypothetical protein A2218_05640 [Elusimicrobia bacterium RIFOXYA2_FULL_53_38]
MKICLIFGTYPPMKDGGAGFVYNLVNALTALGVSVSVLTSGKVRESFLRTPGVTVFPVIDDWAGLDGFYAMRKAITSINPDVIHVIYPSSFFGNNYKLPFFIKLFFRRPVVVTMFSMFKTGSYFTTKLGILALILSADYLMSHDFLYIQFLKKYLFFKKKRISFVPVGNNLLSTLANVDKYQLRGQCDLEQDKIYLAFSGQIDVSKGVETLLRALKILHKNGYSTVRLLMVGSGDRIRASEGEGYDEKYSDYSRKIFSLMHDLCLQDKIVWTGYVSADKFNEYMKCADLAVFPFKANVIGRSSLINALSLGLPVITTVDHSGNLLKDKYNILMVNSGNPQELAAAVVCLLKSPTLTKNIAAGGRELFQNVFTWEAIAEKTLEIYGKAMRRGWFK